MNRLAAAFFLLILIACKQKSYSHSSGYQIATVPIADTSFEKKLSNAAVSLTQQKVEYDPSYFVIKEY